MRGTGVPFLSDIPVLGNLFSDNSREMVKQNLLVFLTPHIVRTREDLQALALDARQKYVRALGRTEVNNMPPSQFEQMYQPSFQPRDLASGGPAAISVERRDDCRDRVRSRDRRAILRVRARLRLISGGASPFSSTTVGPSNPVGGGVATDQTTTALNRNSTDAAHEPGADGLVRRIRFCQPPAAMPRQIGRLRAALEYAALAPLWLPLRALPIDRAVAVGARAGPYRDGAGSSEWPDRAQESCYRVARS